MPRDGGSERTQPERPHADALRGAGGVARLVLTLAEAGAEPNAPDGKGGWTPLHLAAWFNTKPSVVAALLAVGADPAARDDTGKTPWDYARENAALEGTPPYWRLQEEGAE